jgi:hypothetical protein
MAKRVVIWGLKNRRHSHRYIHQSFFDSFQRLGYETVWVDDKAANQKYLEGSNLVFSVHIASEHIVWTPTNHYVLHNYERQEFVGQPNVLNLQVFTRASTGSSVDESIATYDSNSKTLFQPWGISEAVSEWKVPTKYKSDVEFWIGAIWNNSLNQGNAPIMAQYVEALQNHGIKLRRIGGTRSISKSGINAMKALRIVNHSPIGSAIVGDWQRENQYVPCRLFKNIAAGHLPTSNANFTNIVGSAGYFSQDINSIIEHVLALSDETKLELVFKAQNSILPYTYERGIQRILEVL